MGIHNVEAFLLTCDECKKNKLVYKPKRSEVQPYAAKSLGWFVGGGLWLCSNCKAKMKNDLA